MRLVPRQLQIHGLTGDVPYFGGRFTPAQAYAASRSGTGGSSGQPGAPGLVPVGGPRGAIPPVPVGSGQVDPGPIPGIPSSVPTAAPLNVPSTLQPTQVPSVLAPATAAPVPRPSSQVPGGRVGAAVPGPPGTAVPPTAPPQAPGRTAPAAAGPSERPESQRAIQQLLLAGIITTAEADQLAGRLGA